MNTRDAQRLRDEWREKGSPTCYHPDIVKERDPIGGAQTGDRVCTTCGEYWYGLEEVIKMRNEQRDTGIHAECKHESCVYTGSKKICNQCGSVL